MGVAENWPEESAEIFAVASLDRLVSFQMELKEKNVTIDAYCGPRICAFE
jgi:hypothetical protein